MQTDVVETKSDAAPESERLRRIRDVIEEIRPNLRRDGGDCELISVEGNKINVKLTGACVFCKLASATLEGIQAKMVETLGEFVRVVPVPMGLRSGH
ncbi:NifU family protein [Rhodoblastus sp. 17X3]|uniref:NifU family protein n=1 Tax=Rhodoblastus sp. 17X3 TaxID=3047026 RepID=UPI0024B71EE6|nr:NifU family protein [Rhodoblastus sp. 17X3]MDI9846677.1 NifU family protein [Rhodoblastus sp. 17X3]